MTHPTILKLGTLLTAAALCVSSLPCGTAFAEETAASNRIDKQTPEVLVQSAERSDFLMLGFACMVEAANIGVGKDASFSDTTLQLLDLNQSGTIDSADVSTLLYWCAYYGANGTYLDETAAFLERWDAVFSSVTTTAPAETTLTETTSDTEITTTVTVSETEASSASDTILTMANTSTTATTTKTSAASTAATTTTTTAASATTTTAAVTTAATTTAATTTTNRGGAWAQKDSYMGVDVSKYQTNIDWNAVKASGIDFGIIRAGYGKVASQKDPYFEQNMKNAKAAGIACGTYWYSYAKTPDEAKQEAELFASVISGYTFEYPVVLDIEDPSQATLSKEQISSIITAFCDVMESKGYYVSLYSYASFLNDKVYPSVLENYDIWVAHTGVSRPSYTKTSYGMWQYSHKGSVNGISGEVDMNYSYKCYPDLMTKYHLNGF